MVRFLIIVVDEIQLYELGAHRARYIKLAFSHCQRRLQRENHHVLHALSLIHI